MTLFLLRKVQGKTGQVGSVIVIIIGKFWHQTQLGTQPRLVTQPRYEAPCEPRIEII